MVYEDQQEQVENVEDPEKKRKKFSNPAYKEQRNVKKAKGALKKDEDKAKEMVKPQEIPK